MKSQSSSHAAATRTGQEMTGANYRDLQAECAKIAAKGGEEGEIASEIARIREKLLELCEIAERALGR